MLQHHLVGQFGYSSLDAERHRAWTDGYLEANLRIARAIRESGIKPRAFLIQDYHLYPLPALLREVLSHDRFSRHAHSLSRFRDAQIDPAELARHVFCRAFLVPTWWECRPTGTRDHSSAAAKNCLARRSITITEPSQRGMDDWLGTRLFREHQSRRGGAIDAISSGRRRRARGWLRGRAGRLESAATKDF